MNQTTSLLPPPAPILQRAVAWILDAIVLGIALPIVALIIGDRGFAHLGTLLLALLLTASYYIGFLIALSATPGKLAMRLWVCDRNGRRVRPGQAVVRQLVLSASNLSILGFVFFLVFSLVTFASVALMLADRRHRRALHDRIAGTFEVRGRPPPRHATPALEPEPVVEPQPEPETRQPASEQPAPAPETRRRRRYGRRA